MHGKHLQSLANLLDKLDDPVDILFLQEVGGFSAVPEGEWKTDNLCFCGETYRAFVFQAPLAHRATAILFRQSIALEVIHRHTFGVGFLLQCKLEARCYWFGTAHLPHEKRADSEDAWLSCLAQLDETLAIARYHDVVLLGIDANQNLLHANPNFPALARLQFLAQHRGLEFNACCGMTWEARGESSVIDWMLFRWPMSEVAFHLRKDLHQALPSDHVPLVGVFTGRLGLRFRPPRPKHGCGRWITDTTTLEAAAQDPDFHFSQETFANLCRKHSRRVPSLRYSDPPQIQELIRQRKTCNDPEHRARLSAEVTQARHLAQKQHKLNLLESARLGDRAAIGHLRRSAMQSSADGSFIERLGGEDAACESVRSFYAKKYSLPPADHPVSEVQQESLKRKHAPAKAAPVTDEEVAAAVACTKTSTSSGLDSVCYAAIRTFHSKDSQGKLRTFFSKILEGSAEVPKDWVTGKICLIPKVPRPTKVQDMRPISLTPCLGKIFCKILIKRLRPLFPPYKAGQHACRPGTQAIEAISAAQATLRIFKQATKTQLLVCKLDISQAFDTLSHHAIWRFLSDTESSREALALWSMCQETRVCLQLGSKAWSQRLERGVLQGTAFSADLFSRVLDHFVAGLIPRWEENQHDVFRKYSLPHALLFADDILLFASTTSELQFKLRSLQLTLESIGLRLNLDKCSVLDQEDGTTPAVWGKSAARPLSGVEHLVYLGVPLTYRVNPLGQLGISLAKMSSAFFGLRRLFDHPDTPVKEKLLLFQSYITSKWTWCCPTVYPTVRALKSLESFKHTLLLSLLKLQTDPLQPFLANVVSRRRAVKVICEIHKSARWGELWLTRLWTFWGHAFRSKADLPLQHLLAKGSSWRVVSGRSAASDLLFFIPRKLQLVWNLLREGSPFATIEGLAQDRECWSATLPRWLRKWGYGSSEIARLPDNYLYDRQLVLVGKSLAVLRPARVFPEEPYSREVQHIRRGVPRLKQWTVWARILDIGVCLTLIPPKEHHAQATHVQVLSESGELLHRRVCLWETLQSLWRWLPHLQDARAPCFLPPQAFGAHILSHQVPLDLLARVHRLDNLETQIDFLSFCYLHPKQTPHWVEAAIPQTFGPFPGSFKVLCRKFDFSHAKYYRSLSL